MPTFANLKLDRLIVHEVLRASDLEADREPTYSDAFLELDPNGEQLLCKRLTDALGSDSHSVELAVELDASGSCFDVVTQLLDADGPKFVRLSKDLAARLTNAQQAGTIKAGIAVIIDGTMGGGNGNRFVIVMKAESDTGFIKERTEKGWLLRFINDLVLGAQQRLFKIGCFTEKTPGNSGGTRPKEDFDVIVYDHQMSNTGDNNAARYFYGNFLGCRLADNAPRLTRMFYEAVCEFIDGLKLKPQQKMDARSDLVSYLKSQSRHVSVREYAERYLPTAQREPFTKRFRSINFPSRPVPKDLKTIKRKLQVRRIIFSSKVKISAPEEGFHSLVQIKDVKDGWTNVRIKGSLEEQK
jgi:hypothetical protein